MILLDVAGWATRLMESLGSVGAGLAVALENLFPPIPSELILPLAGFTAARGSISLAGALAWTTLGSLAGALVLYTVGAAFGRDRCRRLVGALPLVKVTDVDRAEAWFTRHGAKAVLLGRLVPVVRSLVSLPAGVERLPLTVFVPLTALGSAMWNAILIGAGYGLGERWHVVEGYIGVLQWIVLLAAVVAVGWFVLGRTIRSL